MVDDHSSGSGIEDYCTLVGCFGTVDDSLLGFGIGDSLDSCCQGIVVGCCSDMAGILYFASIVGNFVDCFDVDLRLCLAVQPVQVLEQELQQLLGLMQHERLGVWYYCVRYKGLDFAAVSSGMEWCVVLHTCYRIPVLVVDWDICGNH